MPRFIRLWPWVALLLAGCGPSNRLREYDCDDRAAAVIAAIPPRPAVFTNIWEEAWVDPYNPVGSVLRAGTAAVKQAEARRAQSRLDSALAQVDVAERLARQALLQSAELLHYRAVDDPDEADFLLDIRVHDYGIVASSWRGSCFFELNADVLLVDNRTRRPIWAERVVERERISPGLFGVSTALGNVLTAETLAALTVDEMSRGLARLADFAAERVTYQLRKDYHRARTAKG